MTKSSDKKTGHVTPWLHPGSRQDLKPHILSAQALLVKIKHGVFYKLVPVSNNVSRDIRSNDIRLWFKCFSHPKEPERPDGLISMFSYSVYFCQSVRSDQSDKNLSELM